MITKKILINKLAISKLKTILGFSCARIAALNAMDIITQIDNSITCNEERSNIKINIAATDPIQLERSIIKGIYTKYICLKSFNNLWYITYGFIVMSKIFRKRLFSL